MVRLWSFVVFLCSVCSAKLVIDTQYGAVKGTVLGDGTARAWLGIPYAANTSGANRFGPPKPANSWTGVRSATSFGPGCPQHCGLPTGLCPNTTSEDCLSVNVYAPMTTQTDLRPVFVFIHGGAFFMGLSGCTAYDARILVNKTNTILVSFNYRLGVLGWLINKNSNGNYGILDQRFAMQWVQKNIANFGGDPNQVTLFGQSAGAMSVSFHLIDKASWGLYNRVLIQSHPLGLPFLTESTGSIFTAKVAEAIGCGTDDVECFRKCTGPCLEKILVAQDQGAGLQIFHPFATFLANTPMVGPGSPLSANPYEYFASGAVNPNDGAMFMDLAFPGSISFVEYIGLITDIWGPENVPPITSRYPSLTSGTQRLVNLENLGTDYLFVCVTKHLASRLAESRKPPYMFIFDHVMSFSKAAWGANYSFCDNKCCHGSELPFEFGSAQVDYAETSDEFTMQADLMNAVSNYAHSSNPNSPNALEYSFKNFATNFTYVFATPSRVTTTYNQDLCDFWDSIGYQHSGNFLEKLRQLAIKNRK